MIAQETRFWFNNVHPTNPVKGWSTQKEQHSHATTAQGLWLEQNSSCCLVPKSPRNPGKLWMESFYLDAVLKPFEGGCCGAWARLWHSQNTGRITHGVVFPSSFIHQIFFFPQNKLCRMWIYSSSDPFACLWIPLQLVKSSGKLKKKNLSWSCRAWSPNYVPPCFH